MNLKQMYSFVKYGMRIKLEVGNTIEVSDLLVFQRLRHYYPKAKLVYRKLK